MAGKTNGKKMAGKKDRVWRLAGEPVSPMAFSPAEEQMFLRRFSKLQRKFAMEPDSPIGVSASTAREREKAARLSAPFFLEHCQGPREDVLDALASAVSLPVRFQAWFGDTDFLLMGAALWFLDYAETRFLKKQLASILYAVSDRNDLSLPIMEDAAWPRETLVRMFNLLSERRDGCAREFRKLLKLVQKEDAAALRSQFRDAALDYFLRFYEIETRMRPAADAEPAPAPLLPLPAASDFFHKERVLPREKPDLPDLQSFAEETPGIHFLLRTPELLGASEKKVQSVMFFRRITEKLIGFSTPHPYGICAAALLLEQENDLLWSLNTLTDAVVLCAERSLPFAMQEADYQKPLEQPDTPDQTPCYQFQPPEEDEQSPLGYEIGEGELLNEAQLFYLATGYLLPRHCAPSEIVETWFAKQGVPQPRARELALLAMMASRLDEREDWADVEARFAPGRKRKDRDEGEERDEDERDEDERDEDERDEKGKRKREAEEAASRTAADDSRVLDLNRQLKEARGALHDAEQTIRQLREQLSLEQQSAMQNKMELSNLRDTLFRMRSTEQPEGEERSAGISFPWTGRRRILAFGGHDTWSKAIRPLLPGVRFCDRELLPDLNAIKSADIVWIQPNALSHKFYYRIIETARKENIPVRYFGFASARKCAEQLVEAELSAEGD